MGEFFVMSEEKDNYLRRIPKAISILRKDYLNESKENLVDLDDIKIKISVLKDLMKHLEVYFQTKSDQDLEEIENDVTLKIMRDYYVVSSKNGEKFKTFNKGLKGLKSYLLNLLKFEIEFYEEELNLSNRFVDISQILKYNNDFTFIKFNEDIKTFVSILSAVINNNKNFENRKQPLGTFLKESYPYIKFKKQPSNLKSLQTNVKTNFSKVDSSMFYETFNNEIQNETKRVFKNFLKANKLPNSLDHK